MRTYPNTLVLPNIDPKKGKALCCVICGGKPSEDAPGFEIVLPDGTISMTTDDDLCLECAIHFWRAFKAFHGANARNVALELLGRYSVTRDAVQAQSQPWDVQ
jgi:hypothetical protein